MVRSEFVWQGSGLQITRRHDARQVEFYSKQALLGRVEPSFGISCPGCHLGPGYIGVSCS